MTDVQIAHICHETNRAYCETIGDKSQLPWDKAPEWQTTSAIAGVKFHREHPEAKPQHSHDQWMEEKAKTGWQHGPFKDENKKEHPCFVAYDDLPEDQKLKDSFFIAIVNTALGR